MAELEVKVLVNAAVCWMAELSNQLIIFDDDFVWNFDHWNYFHGEFEQDIADLWHCLENYDIQQYEQYYTHRKL